MYPGSTDAATTIRKNKREEGLQKRRNVVDELSQSAHAPAAASGAPDDSSFAQLHESLASSDTASQIDAMQVTSVGRRRSGHACTNMLQPTTLL